MRSFHCGRPKRCDGGVKLKCFGIHLPNRRQYLCDLQGSQGKPIAPGVNSNAPAKRQNSRQQQRVDPHKMFIIVLESVAVIAVVIIKCGSNKKAITKKTFSAIYYTII